MSWQNYIIWHIKQVVNLFGLVLSRNKLFSHFSFQHIIFYDNCHSHVAKALNIMNYGGSKNWNMVKLAVYMIPYSKYVR